MEYNAPDKEGGRDVFLQMEMLQYVCGLIYMIRERRMAIGVDDNCSSDVLEQKEGVGKESRVHMEDLVPNRFHHTIQEWCLQNADYTDASLTSRKNANSWWD